MNVLIDGRPGEAIPVSDRGLLYGDGLFETLRVQDGAAPLWRLHWRRLSEGCQRLGLELPAEDTLLDEIRRVAPEGARMVRVTVTRGDGRGYGIPADPRPRRILQAFPLTEMTSLDEGIQSCVCHYPLTIQPDLAGLKHLARLEQVRIASELQRRGYQEGIVMDVEQRLVEGCQSNLFLIQGGQLRTPDLIGCGVEGVYRQLLIERETVEITDLVLADLENADGVFFCNAVHGIIPVREVEGVGRYSVAPALEYRQRMES